MKYLLIMFTLMLFACVENNLCDDNKVNLDVRECTSVGGEESVCKEKAQYEHCMSIDF